MIGQSLTFYNERITCSNTGAGLQTGLSTLFWKRSHHPLRVVFLSITQLLRTCQGKPAALWVFFLFFSLHRTFAFTVLTSLCTGVTNVLFQVSEVS